MPLYTVPMDHALLVEHVRRLDQPAFDAQVLTAELLLGLKAPALTDESDVERLHLALVHQINFQVRQGIEPLLQHSSGVSSHASSSVVWRDRYINPIAAQIVVEVIPAAAGWLSGSGQQSLRTNDGGGHRVRANGGWYRWPEKFR